MKSFFEKHKVEIIRIFAIIFFAGISPFLFTTLIYWLLYHPPISLPLGEQPPYEVRFMYLFTASVPGLLSLWKLPIKVKFRTLILLLISLAYLAALFWPLGMLSLRLGCPGGICE